MLAPGPDGEVATVRRIYQLYIEGKLGYRALARRLDAEGATALDGAPWTEARVKAVLINEMYCGVLLYNRTTGSFTQLDINVTQRVARCFRKWTPLEFEAHPGQKYDFASPDAQISVTAVIAKSEARDPLHNYVIDLAPPESFFKTTSIEASYYESGVLKGLNAAAEDKTGEFISSTVGTLAELASAAVAQNFVAI